MHANETVTSSSYQPAPLGARSFDAVTDGRVRSSLTVTDAVAVLPVLSVAVPPTRVPSVSSVTVRDADAGEVPSATQDATPEPPSSSAQVKVTVASLLFQPAPFGAGETSAVMVGAVSSAGVVANEAVRVLPALSVAVPVTVLPAGTVVERDAGLVPSATQLATPDGWAPGRRR